jgi:ribosome-associated protein
VILYKVRSSREGDLEPVEVARKAIDAASDKQATDIVMLDMRAVSTFADYFVILSGESKRQIEAISDEIHRVLGEEGIAVQHREGSVDSGWILMDFSGVIIHIFAPSEREYYHLERLWSKATPLIRIQ